MFLDASAALRLKADWCTWIQEEKAEQVRSLSFLAGILLSFGMAALYQLVYSVAPNFNGIKMLYSLTIALTVRTSATKQSLPIDSSVMSSIYQYLSHTV